MGRTDIVDFPKLDLFGVEVKIDTGAYTSSIHCHSIKVIDNVLQCQFVDSESDKHPPIILHFNEFATKMVKSSNGITEKRFAIKTEILIFKKTYRIELTLTERGSMRFPVLLGRKFITRKFIIDTSKKDLSFKNIKIKLKQT